MITTPSSPASGSERGGGRSGNRLGEGEVAMVLGLAEVLAAEKLLEADDLGAPAAASRIPLMALRMLASGILHAAVLHQPERDGGRGGIVSWG